MLETSKFSGALVQKSMVALPQKDCQLNMIGFVTEGQPVISLFGS